MIEQEIRWRKHMDDPNVDALDVRVFIDKALIELQDDPKQFIKDAVDMELSAWLETDPFIQKIEQKIRA